MRINKSLITYIPTSGSGSGTVTSVALSATMPTGLTASISGSPITSSGTLGLTLTFSAGYSIPTTIKQGQWDDAYSFVTGFPVGTEGQLVKFDAFGDLLAFTPNFITNPMTSLGDMIYGNAVGLPLRLAPNTTTTKKYLSMTGDGTNGDQPFWDTITATSLGAVPSTRTITINGTTQDLSANRTYNVGTVTSVAISVPTGLSVSGTPITTSGTFAISLQSGYSIPTTAKQTEWDSAYTNRITTLTTTGNSGSASLISNTLNVPTYTLAGLGGMSNPFTTGIGQMIYSNGAGAPLSLAPNTSTTKKYLSMTGDGTNGDAPFWDTITGITGTGTTNYVVKFTSSTALGNSLIFDNGTNVGIGTATPSSKLDVVGSGTISGIASLGISETTTLAYIGDRNTLNTRYIKFNRASALTNIVNIQGVNGGIGADNIAINAEGGNVGIGTVTPQNKLDVQGIINAGSNSATEGTIILQDQYTLGHLTNFGTNRSSGGVVLGYGVYPSGVSTNAFISSTSISVERAALSFDGNFRWYTGSSQTVSIGTAATLTERMVLSNIGNLTIKAATGGTSLTVTDSVNSTFYITHPSTGRTSFYNGANTRWLTELGGDLGLEGSVAIGGSTPLARLHVKGGTLATSGTGLMVAAEITNGRLETYDATSCQAIHTYFDSQTYEISAGSTSGYVSGIAITGRGATLLPDRVAIYTRSTQRLQVGGLGQLQLNAYTSASSFTGTPTAYLACDSSGNIITSNPSTGRNTRLAFSAEVPNTWANMPTTLQFFDSSSAYVTQIDLSYYNQVRLIVNKQGTAGATGSKLLVRYQATSGSPFTESSYLDIGTSEVSVLVDTTSTILTTSWINLASGAIGDVWVALMGIDGDTTADPVFGNIYAEFRFN